MDGRPTWTDCDEAGDYVVPNVLSPRDLVFRPDNMDETVPHTHFTNMLAFDSVFCKLFLKRYKKHQPPIKFQLCMVATFSNFVICPLSLVHRTAEMYS